MKLNIILFLVALCGCTQTYVQHKELMQPSTDMLVIPDSLPAYHGSATAEQVSVERGKIAQQWHDVAERWIKMYNIIKENEKSLK